MPAPELAEVARIWWDVDHDPVVTWDVTGRSFCLADPQDHDARLHLVTFADPVADPARIAGVLAEAFAACDFPPTGDGVGPDRAALTLRRHGITAPLA